MNTADMIAASRELAREKGIPFEIILEGLQEAMASAYKAHWKQENPTADDDFVGFRAEIDADSGEMRMFKQDLEEVDAEDGESLVMEVRGEKIDVVPWSDNPSELVANALQPAKVKEVITDPDTQTAQVVVPDYQLSLAIGKEGQNARLAARLTGWRIDIKSETQAATPVEPAPAPTPEPEPTPAPEPTPEPAPAEEVAATSDVAAEDPAEAPAEG